MKIVVGLGNPGPTYARSRHNIGFNILDLIAKELSLNFTLNKRFNAEMAQGERLNERFILLKPMTYMNLSGEAVSKALNFYKATANDMVVIYDDIDLPEGKVKLKEKGGHGGHNGVRSLITRLGTSDFTRIKVGVGRPSTQVQSEDKQEVTNWLLQPINNKAYSHLVNSVLNDILDRLDIFFTTVSSV